MSHPRHAFDYTSLPLAEQEEPTEPGKRTRIPSEFFEVQPTQSVDLPDPRPLLENLTRCVIEILAGVRELDQIARWVNDEVYRHLTKRVVISARARAVKGVAAVRPQVTLGTVTITHPRDGVVEAVVIVHSKKRTRAVAIRLEGWDGRWRAAAVNVL